MTQLTETEKLAVELANQDKKHFIHPTSSLKQLQEHGPAVIFAEGNGIYLKDIHGKQYIDGFSCLWNVNIGHGRKELGEVAAQQMAQLGFSSCFGTFSHEPVIRLAAKIAQITPSDLNATFFTSGGSESNDSAFKIVRHYWKLKGKPEKNKIISRRRSYHGVAMGATSATQIENFRKFTTTLPPGFIYTDNTSPAALRDLIEQEGAETIAAFISEPVQGTGGVVVAPEKYFQEVRQICDEYNILLIADEVITGFGRTGTYFGMEHYQTIADVMTIAKGITSGYIPLGGVVLSEKIHQELTQLSEDTFFHGFTYSGHPVACAVALKNIAIVEEEDLITNAKERGNDLLQGFHWLQDKHELVGQVRGLGLMGAIELVKNKATNERYTTPVSPKVVAECLQLGLICRGMLYDGGDTLLFAPPLVISKQQVEEMIQIIDESLTTVQKDVLG